MPDDASWRDPSSPQNQRQSPFNRGTLSMLRQIRMSHLISAGLCLAFAGVLTGSGTALASDDAVRNTMARKDCVRGKFKDYYLQGRGGDPSANYKGRVFKLSQDYPTDLPSEEAYPWLK